MIASVPLDDASGRDAASALELLFRTEQRNLLRLATLLLDDRSAAEEVVQDAFVKLQLGWRRLRDPDHAAAWLRSAVLNGARSQLRRRSVRRRRDEVDVRTAASAETAALHGDEQARMLAALRQLPTRQREALVLRYYADLSETEIATAMGVSSGSVKTHAHRGLAALATILGEDR
jgi:RNA polymerase sigma-70 factor (sigma-E family)